MGIHNNFPTKSWIKLDGISVVKDEEVYIVKDFKTNLKYIYWCSDSPDQLTASNAMLNRTDSRFLIVVNNKGESVLVPNEEITVSFDGNSVGAINEHIWGLHEKNEEYGSKFVSIEQNIEGITQTVGQTREELGKVTEDVSKIDQKADSIDLSVKNLDREYNKDKNIQELREGVNNSIINVNTALGLFKQTINETFKDNEISQDDSVAIQSHISILEDRKTKVINQVDKVIDLVNMENEKDTTKLTSQKQAFINAIDNVVTLVNTSISDEIIVPSEITVVTDAFGRANVVINTLKNTIDELIFLGAGGTISEELARIEMKSDEIVLSVSKVEQKVDNDTAFIKEELVEQIRDVNDALNGLEDTMNNSFLDGVLSDSEKISLKRSLDTLATEKLDIDKQYESIYGNTDLTGVAKTNLKNAYDTYTQKYDELVNVIDTAINKENNIDINDQSNINSCIVAHRNALGELSKRMSEAIDAIANNKASAVDKKYSEILLTPDGIVSRVGRVESKTDSNGNRLNSAESRIEQLSNRITSTVTEGDVKSIIEQSPNEIKYGFNGISSYVTIGTYGLDVKKGSIACDSIKASSSNPVIKLFEGNGLRCEIDATDYMGYGIGEAIRLKRDDSNYIYVGKDNVSLYTSGAGNSELALCTFRGDTTGRCFKMVTKGGNLELKDGVSYNGTKVSLDGHAHSWSEITGKPSSYTPSSHNHSGDVLRPDTVVCRAFGSGGSTIMHNSLDGNGKNLGWSGSKFNQLTASSVWAESGNVSDMRFKENIHYIETLEVATPTLAMLSESEEVVDTLLKPNKENNVNLNIVPNDLYNFVKDELKLCEYNYTKEFLGDTKVENFENKLGFIAQDLVGKKVGDLIVGEHEGGLAYSLNNYVSVAVGALQVEMKKGEERDREIEILKRENTSLKQELFEIKEMLNQILQK